MSGRHRRCAADDALLREVGDLFDRLDPVPQGVYTAALEAMLLRGNRMGEELLRVVGDSAVDELLVGMRGERSVGVRRVLDFADAVVALSVHVELSSGGAAGPSLCGMIEASTPPGVALLRSTGIVHESIVDDLGRFRFEGLPSGPVRVELEQGPGRRIVTPWFAG